MQDGDNPTIAMLTLNTEWQSYEWEHCIPRANKIYKQRIFKQRVEKKVKEPHILQNQICEFQNPNRRLEHDDIYSKPKKRKC